MPAAARADKSDRPGAAARCDGMRSFRVAQRRAAP